MMTVLKFKTQYNIDARVSSEVVSINQSDKSVTVKDLASNKEYTETYDKLIISTGAKAIMPKLDGIENANVFALKNVEDTTRLYNFIKSNNVKKITVVGGGYIGIETAENLRMAGYEVSVIEAQNQILNTFDYDMVCVLEKEMLDKGVKLHLGKKAVSCENSNLILEDGTKVEGDAIVMAVGVTPDTSLAKQADIPLTDSGHILVTPNYQTKNNPDIYAVGDAIQVTNAITKKPFTIQLAGPAQKQARQVANHIYNIPVRNTGYIGSSSIKVFDYNSATTGLTQSQAEKEGLDYDVVYIIPNNNVGIMPNNSPFHFKVVYELPTGRILGAQAVSKGDASKRVDVVATLIKFNGTIEDMADLELCYAPPVSTAKDPTNMAGLVSLNLIDNRFKQVTVDKVRSLVEQKAFIVDVREEHEYALSHIKGVINIPLSVLRENLDKFPKDAPIYLHCRSAQRSYNACLVLQAKGFSDVYNVSGGYLGISFYEYVNDVIYNRESILTGYNFD